MREEEAEASSSTCSTAKANSGRGSKHYKLWFLGAIVLLALCSILTTASLLLNFYTHASATSSSSHDDFDPKTRSDFDILDLEQREKTVKEMWSLYHQHQHNNNFARLQSFWRDAFAAAYEELTSDVPGVREEAVVEIAKMSFRSRLVILYDSGRAFKEQVKTSRRGRKL